MAKKHRLEILAILKDELSVPLKRINKALNLTSTGSKKVKTSSTSAAKGLDKVGHSADKTKRKTSSLYQVIKRLSRGLSNLKFLAGAAIAALGVYAMVRFGKAVMKVTTEVEKLTAEIGTLVGGRTRDNLGDLSFAIRHMAVMGGQSLKDEFGAAYDAISAGMPHDRLLEFLEAANKLAIGGVTDVATATNLLTSVMNSFNIDMDNMDDVLDSLFQTVKFGKLRIADLANSIGRVAPIAQKAGLTLDEMNGAIATLTVSGLKTEEATTALRQMLNTIMDLTPEARESLEGLGLSEYFSLDRMRKVGFTQFIVEFSKMLKGNEDELASFIGNIRALTGMLSLVSKGGERLSRIMAGYADKAGAANAAAEMVTNTLGHQLSRLNALRQAFLVDIGNTLFEGLMERVKELVDVVEGARVGIKQLKDEMMMKGSTSAWKAVLKDQLEVLVGALRSTLHKTFLGLAQIIGVVFLNLFTFLGREFGMMIYNSLAAAVMNWANANPTLASILGLEQGSIDDRYSSDPGVRAVQLEQELEGTKNLAREAKEWVDLWEHAKTLQRDWNRELTRTFVKQVEEKRSGSIERIIQIGATKGLEAAWNAFTKDVSTSGAAGNWVFEGMDFGQMLVGAGPGGREMSQSVAFAFMQIMGEDLPARTEKLTERVANLKEEIRELSRVQGEDLIGVLEASGTQIDSLSSKVGDDLSASLRYLLSIVEETKKLVGIDLPTGLEVAEEKTTFLQRAVRAFADAVAFANQQIKNAIEISKRISERLDQLKAKAEIDILKALGLKDAAEILEIRADIAKLKKDLADTGVLDIVGRQQVTDGIMIKELESARLEIQRAMNLAMKKYKDLIKAANDAKRAGEISGGDYRGTVKEATDAYNASLGEQMAILDQLALRYPQATEAIESFRDTLREVDDLANQLTVQWGDSTDALEGFVSGLGASKNVLNAVGQAIGSRLGSAIDGLITGTKTLGQAFREMAIGIIQDIAKIIVKMMIMLALNSMYPGMGFAAGAAFNKGGRVQGFSGGGYLARFGPDRDSIPAMLTPGEFVIKRSAVDRYGVGLLSAINNMIAPQDLSGMAKSASNYRGRVQGFNSGGEVASGGGGKSAGPQPAYIVANERSMQSLLTGGKSAMLEFLRENRGAFSGNSRGGS